MSGVKKESYLFLKPENIHFESLSVISVNVRISILNLCFEMRAIDHKTQA